MSAGEAAAAHAAPMARGERRFYLEWLLLACLSLAGLLWLSMQQALPVLGQVAYDGLHRLSPAQPRADTVIIAIDDASLQQLGGWPLSRRVYAELLRRLADSHNEPRRIGFDVLFLDPRPEDAELATQIRRHRVVLPVELSEQGGERQVRLPVAPYPQAASTLAHIQVTFESDGVLRGLHLQDQGRPHFAVAMAGMALPEVQGAQAYRRFRLTDPAHRYETVSLADVLSGRYPLSGLKDRYVLIGATAPSLGDHYPTVHAGRLSSGTPGVELHANALQALLGDQLIEDAPQAWQRVIGVLAVALVLGSLLVWGPLAQLLWAGAVLLSLLLVSQLLLTHANLWFDPGPAWLMIALLKPAWSWRRTRMVVRFMEERAQALEAVTQPLAQQAASGPLGRLASDAVMRYSRILDDALEVVKQQLSSLSAIVHGAPNAMLVLDAQGRMTLFNQRLRAWLPTGLVHEGAPVGPLLLHLGWDSAPALNSLVGQDHVVTTRAPAAGERHYVLNVIALSPDAGQHMHLLSLLDITDMRTLQAQRERTLELLSHDMRTPVASIMALADQRTTESADKVRRHAHTLLQMMDDFILSIQSKEQHYALAETLFEDLLDEAVYQVRDLAQQRQMPIEWSESEAGTFVPASARLLIRVLANVLVNAIRYGEPGTPIVVALEVLPAQASSPSRLQCTVRNQVAGPASVQVGTAHKGFGLGTGFVEEVMHKHHGQVQFEVRQPAGAWAEVRLLLPLAPPGA